MKGHFFVKRIRIGLVGLVVLSLTGLAAGGASAAVSGRGTASSSPPWWASPVGTSIPDLSVLRGLPGIKGGNIAGLSTSANTTASKGDTGRVTIDSVDVLSLQGLLGGLGLNLADLPLGPLTGILDQLGLNVVGGTLGNLTGGGITELLGNVTGLLNVKNGLAGAADCGALTSLVTNNLGGLGDLSGLLGNGGPLRRLVHTPGPTLPGGV